MIETPRSPRRRFRRYSAYCTGSGRSRPISRRYCWTMSGAASKPSAARAGSVGTRWLKAKVRPRVRGGRCSSSARRRIRKGSTGAPGHSQSDSATAAIARETSASPISRCVTNRDRVSDRRNPRTPRAASRPSSASAARPVVSAETTMLVCTVSRSTWRPGRAARPDPELPRPTVVVGQPVDHRLERDDAGGGGDAGLVKARGADHPEIDPCSVDDRARAGEQGAARGAQALPRLRDTVSTSSVRRAAGTPRATAALRSRAPSRWTLAPCRWARKRAPPSARASPRRHRRCCACSPGRAPSSRGRPSSQRGSSPRPRRVRASRAGLATNPARRPQTVSYPRASLVAVCAEGSRMTCVPAFPGSSGPGGWPPCRSARARPPPCRGGLRRGARAR